MNTLTTQWSSLDDCQRFARQLAEVINSPICVALNGTLGAGKTQFVRFMVEAMGGSAELVSSPTFVLVNLYQARLPIAHIDLYRLKSAAELDTFGFEDYIFGEYVCFVEWSNKFAESMPIDSLTIDIDHADQARCVKLTAEADSMASRSIDELRERLNENHAP
jgi:tRNA threonylcarbamoyl adenosine modification protein YjeE